MSKRGDQAREAVKNKIIEAFGSDFVAFLDKKIYVQAKDGLNGDTIQFAITMTMPKNPVETAGPQVNSGTVSSTNISTATTSAEMSEADKAKVAALMEKLGVKPAQT